MSCVTLISTRSLRTNQTIPPNVAQSTMTRSVRAGHIVVEPQSGTVLRRVSQTIAVEPDRRRGSMTEVMREPTSYWEDKDWVRSGDTYAGYFGTNGTRWPGAIIWDRHGLRGCFISNPPHELWKHQHAPCFCYIGDGRYAVHFSKRPQTLDGAIMTVERILSEAVGGES